MNNRALVGWLLAGAFCAAVSCSNKGGGGVPGFGLACESDKQCNGYDLLCHPTEEKCVQCVGKGDCKTGQDCIAGLCKAPQRCKDSRDCTSDTVCNETVGVCVECLQTRDCESGQKCVSQRCVEQQTCMFTSDCEGGLLCDMKAQVCVTCREDRDCPTRRVCEDGECVVPGPAGEGGEGGTGTAGSNSTGGKSTGGTPGGGAGGSGGSSGSGGGGAGGSGGGGGMPPACECTLGDVCTPDDRCVAPTVIDDFVECDDAILEIEGRAGPWYAEADTDVDFIYGFGDPGSDWGDRTCGAWVKGGTELGGTFYEFAILAIILNDGAYYDLSSYSGIQVQLESDNAVEVVLKTPVGLFRGTLNALANGTSNLRTMPFGSMISDVGPDFYPIGDYLDLVSEIQFAAPDRSSFGFAVHHVELY